MRTEAETRRAMNRLNRLGRRPTRHEVVVEVVGGGADETWLAAYAPRPGKAIMRRLATPVPPRIVERAGVTEASDFGYDRERGWWFVGSRAEIRIRRGRTERRAILEGELPPLPRPAMNN